MKGEKRTKKKFRAGRFLLSLFGIFLSLLLVAGIGFTFYLQKNYETVFPQALLKAPAEAVPPVFYQYDFTDRTQRIGPSHVLETSGFTQPPKNTSTLSELPQSLKDAFVAIEDKRFYQHRGVDWYRTAAAGVNSVLGYSERFGASTITQQLIKNLSGNNEITFHRKMQEILYALDLEKKMSKDEILERYLNIVPFSEGCIGVTEAARHYFSKLPLELTVAESATIAAITNNPSYYNPIKHPENALRRRNIILRELFDQGYLSEEETERALNEPLVLDVDETDYGEGLRSWYVDMVLDDVVTDLSEKYHLSRSETSKWVLTGGLRIDLAQDQTMQDLVEEYYRNSLNLPKNKKGESAQSALIVIDSHTGDVLAVAGAVGEKTANRIQNFATQTLRPPGSAIKPITVYAPALQEGIITWASVYDDVPVNFNTSGNRPWPYNANRTYRGLTDIPYAVAHSTNTVAVRVLNDLGIEKSFRIAKEQYGLKSLYAKGDTTDCNPIALGLGQMNYGLTLRELTTAYTAFADGGVYHPYRSYYRVTDKDGTILLSNADTGKQVLSPENAAIMTKLLQGVIANGTAQSVTMDKICECAGKTGTTQNNNDRWFIGYTPDYICGVWYGYEYPESLAGKNLCNGIWNDVMHRIYAAEGGQTHFTVPETVIRSTYCKDSGDIPSDACRYDPRGGRTATGWFAIGTEPIAHCHRHVLCLGEEEEESPETIEEAEQNPEGLFEDEPDQPSPYRESTLLGLLRLPERSFPQPVSVADEKYRYRNHWETLFGNRI